MAGMQLERLRGVFRQSLAMHLLLLASARSAPPRAREGAESEQLLLSCMVEWQQVLHKGRVTFSIELPGVGTEASLPVGSLKLKLELVPSPYNGSQSTSPFERQVAAFVTKPYKPLPLRLVAWTRVLYLCAGDWCVTHDVLDNALFALTHTGQGEQLRVIAHL